MANCEISIGDLYEIRERMMYGHRVLLSCRDKHDVGVKQIRVMRYLKKFELDFNYTRNSLALIKYRGFLHFVYDDRQVQGREYHAGFGGFMTDVMRSRVRL